MSLEAVNAALALFKIDRIAGKIPVVEPIAIRMEVEAFLTDGSGGEDEWPERRVEGVPHAAEPRDGALVIAVVREAHRKAPPHLEFADGDDLGAHLWIVDINLRWPDGQSCGHRTRNTRRPFFRRRSAQAFGI